MPDEQKSKFGHLPLSTKGPLECALKGTVLLNHPFFNKGSAFSKEERRDFELSGLLPQGIQSLEQQAHRAYEQYSSRADDLAKNTFLTSMKEQNHVLYFKMKGPRPLPLLSGYETVKLASTHLQPLTREQLLQDHLDEMFSVVYTPTEGDAIQNFSRLFRRPEGCFLNIHDIDRIPHDLSLWGEPEDIDYIVVTDGEEILGIGDQGCGGILISVAKLVLTTLCAGIHPNRVLPVVLDCGTDNERLLNDPLYLGLREKRVRGPQYDKFVDTFIESARKLYPRAYIHFEDFGLDNARRILDKYRDKIPCFNDDVQGTGCVTLAAIMAGLHVSNQKLSDLRMIIFGAGTAGVGVADQVRDAIATERGISKEEASKQIWLIDKPGLLTTGTPLTEAQKPFAKPKEDWTNKPTDLHSIVEAIHPNVLIGTSTVRGAFTEPIIRAMASHTPRPIILPLSNPTRLHEAVPSDLLRWTSGAALVATGSPSDPVRGPWGPGGSEITVRPAECNNSVVFPGVGLGCVLARAARLTDRMLVAAVGAVAGMSPALQGEGEGEEVLPLLPGVDVVRDVSVRVAAEVVRAAVREGVATEEGIPEGREELEEWIREQMWDPVYRPLKLVGMEGASRQARGELRVVGSLDTDGRE